MPLLLYYIAERELALPIRPGVQYQPLSAVCWENLQCICSQFGSRAIEQEQLKAEVIDFHAVIRDAFARGPVIPFRYPATAGDQAEVLGILQSDAEQYLAALASNREYVQVDIRLNVSPIPECSPTATGREYLEGKRQIFTSLEEAAGRLRSSLETCCEGWIQQREGTSMRCSARVHRSLADSFRQRAGKLELAGVSGTVSGPWPVTRFLSPSLLLVSPALSKEHGNAK